MTKTKVSPFEYAMIKIGCPSKIMEYTMGLEGSQYQFKTPATEDWPEIEWEQGKIFWSEDRQTTYLMYGTDQSGKEYLGQATYCCGERVTGVEEIERL